MARNASGSGVPPVGSAGVGPVTSARIAPAEKMLANTDWARAGKLIGKLGTSLNVFNVVTGFKSSFSDGLYATADWTVGGLLALVPYAGVPLSVAYSGHGGTRALVNDGKYLLGQCRRQ